MEGWLWALAGILAVMVVLLCVKIHWMHKAADEIREAFAERLTTDTNTLISISSNDRFLKQLADGLNIELRQLRSQRRRFLQGDRELKEAVTNISHDLRTPLTAIFGYLDLLSGEELSPDAKRYLSIMKNRAALSRVFANLLHNAVKYSKGDLEIRLLEDGKVTFFNDAPELDAVQVGRLFDRFYTVEAADHGTGLGLSIARTLTERMGGKIDAGYEKGRLKIEIWLGE